MIKEVNDRSKNWLRSQFVQDANGNWQEIRIPYTCDLCLAEPAKYGSVEAPGSVLKCATCNMKQEENGTD